MPLDLGLEQDTAAASAERLYSADQFAGVIRKLYPTLAAATPDNNKLTSAILKVHPEFRDHVIDPDAGMADAAAALGYDPRTTRMVQRPYGEGLSAAPPGPLTAQEVSEGDQTPALRRASARTLPPPRQGGAAPAGTDPIGGAGMVKTTAGELRAGARRQDEGAPAQVLAAIPEGLTRAAGGISELSRSMPGARYPSTMASPTLQSAAQAGANAIGGTMQAGSILIPEALVNHPVQAITGIVGGSLAASGVEQAGEAMQAPPAYVHLASEITGLIAGIGIGEGAGAVKDAAVAGNDRFQRVVSRAPGAMPPGAVDTAGNAVAEGMMQDATVKHAEGQMLDTAQQYYSDRLNARMKTKTQNAEIDKLSLGLAETYSLQQIAIRMKAEQYAHGSAFDTVDAMTADRGAGAPPLALSPMPEPRGYLEAGSPARFLADASDQAWPGPSLSAVDPNRIDVTDPTRAAIGQQLIATSTQAPPRLIQRLGEQLASGLEHAPPQTVRPTPETTTKLIDRLDFKAQVRSTLADAVSQMEEQRHARSGYVTDIHSGETYHTPATAGSDWYWHVVGRDTKNPPTRAVITELMRAYKDSGGALLGKDLSPEVVKAGMDATGHTTEGGFRRQYETFASDIKSAIEHRAKAVLTYQRTAQERAAAAATTEAAAATEASGTPEASEAMPEEAAAGTETPQPVQGTEGVQPDTSSLVENQGDSLPVKAGPPSSVELPAAAAEAAASTTATQPDDLPEFLKNLQPESDADAQERLSQYGVDVPERPAPLADDASQAEVRAFLRKQALRDMYDRLTSDEGHLILNVGPNNKRGISAWLDERAEEYGDQEWYQHAQSLMAAGDHGGAWRVAAIASSKALGGVAASDTREGKKATAGVTVGETRMRTAVETQLGYTLPKDTSVSPETGVITFPENGGVTLKARFSDLTLGKTFLTDVLQAVDPTQITRVEDSEGHLDDAFVSAHPEMRVTSQMADQIVRDMPPSILEAFKETGLTEVQIGAHFRRAFRQAGQVLNMAKQWQDTNWESILHLDPLTGSTRGPGAAGRLEFLPQERAKAISDYLENKRQLKQEDYAGILADIQKLSPKEMTSLGFDLPPGIAEDSKQAVTYTRNWLNRQQKLLQLGKQVEAIAAANPDIDRAMLSAALGGTDESVPGKIRETYLSLMRSRLSFLISQTSTGFHVLASQGVRYAFGMPEELIRSAAAAASGDTKGAAEYLGFAKNLAQNVVRPGKIPMGLLKRPWTDGVPDLFEWAGTAFGDMPAGDIRKSLMAMERESPQSLSHMMATLELSKENPDVPGSTRVIPAPVTNFLTAFMRFHAGMYRSMVSDAMIRNAIEQKGDNANAILASEGGLTDKYGADEAGRIFNASVAAALNYTQAGDAYAGVVPIGGHDKVGGTFPAQIIDIFNMKTVPEVGATLRMAIPFPRFVFGAVPRYVWDRMPGTIVADIARANFPIFGKGRLGLGLEMRTIEKTTIPHLEQASKNAEVATSLAMTDLVQANEDTGTAAKAFKAVEARAAKAGGLPGMEADLAQVHDDLLARLGQKSKAAEAYKAADRAANDIRQQLDKQTEKLHKLQEIDPPDYKAALARQTMGAVFLTAAIGIRAGQKDETKWSDIRVGDHDVDSKFMSGLSQFMLVADVIVNFQRHTDWQVVESELHKAGYSKEGIVGQAAGDPAHAIDTLRKAMATGYTGKYTKAELAKEAAESFLSLAPLIGGMSSIVDMTTGKGAAGESVLDHPVDFLATYIGQAMGGFTLPARQFADLLGSIYQPEALSYTPETPGDHNSLLKELYQPALANIPGARELITPKVSALTGEPKSNDLSGLKPLGVSAKVTNKIERELEANGLPYAEAVPKVFGDRPFDNAVAKAYATLLNEYTDQLLAIPEYKGANPAIRRDLFKTALASLKQAALYQAGEALGLTGEQTYDKIESPAKKARQQMYEQYMEELQQEQPAAQKEPKPQAQLSPNAPPSALPGIDAGPSLGSRHGLQRGAPPAGLSLS